MFESFSMTSLITINIFLVVTILVYILLQLPWLDPYHSKLKGRLKSIERNRSVDFRVHGSSLVQSDEKESNWLHSIHAGTNIPSLLMQAGYYGNSAFTLYCVSCLVCMASVLVLSGMLFLFLPQFASLHSSIVVLILTGGGMFLPRLWLHRAVEKRHRLLRKSIPDLFELMIVCFDAGLSLPYTLRRVSQELQIAHPVLASELMRVQNEIEMGASLELALSNFANRSNFDGLKSLCVLVREVNRFGSDITQALRDHADLLRTQREVAAEELAQKASVKIIFPILLFILPAVFVVVAGPAFIQLSITFAKGKL